ncbi:hypothetical protein CDL15_Pgr018221 [Punica granatum]|uniref:Uncharacterized protein n=1 Tax=Punica granatum TaxID=22663 RepID=A0A218WI33_PUNGR|nr:hypothetical protein CDL15_Pgr018221 [Punica granatum]
MACPRNAITYNGTLCACSPGYLLNRTSNSCDLFVANATILANSGVDSYAVGFPETIFSFETIRKFTQSQAVFLEATVVLLLSWLVFCFFLRFMKLGDGKNVWFQIRWWISRLDVCFATRHWLDDQKVVRKRKTELGGTFSIAISLRLLYQIITKRNIEVHNVRATNAPDLLAFRSDMEFNITTISSMSCANLRNLGNLVTGSPGLFDYRVASLSSFGNFSCLNTTFGPTISIRCNNCQLTQDNIYFSWEFVDLPNSPAAAVGFQFNLSSKPHANKQHMSFVSGFLCNGSSSDDRPVTYRGTNTNILKFNLFPSLYRHQNNLRLIQPLFHGFLHGSYFDEASQLQASLQSSGGLINTTVYLHFLSAYIVEVDRESIFGPVSFLADLGGLFCISIGIFYYLLVQFEYRVKKLRNEDSTLRKIRSRRKARERWDKLRKYVRYTWDCRVLDEDDNYKNGTDCSGCFHRNRSLQPSKSSWKQRYSSASMSLNQKSSLPIKENAAPGVEQVQQVTTYIANNDKQHSTGSDVAHTLQPQVSFLTDDQIIPPPPPLEFKADAAMDITDVQKNLTRLYEYNAMMREKLAATQSLFHDLAKKSSQESTRQM